MENFRLYIGSDSLVDSAKTMEHIVLSLSSEIFSRCRYSFYVIKKDAPSIRFDLVTFVIARNVHYCWWVAY